MDPDVWAPTVMHNPRASGGTPVVRGPISLVKGHVTTSLKASGNKAESQPLSKGQWKTLVGAEDVTEAKSAVATVSRTLGIKIAQARADKGLKRSELAQRLSIREAELGAWENGTALFNPGMLTRLNRALGTQLKKDE
jgi:ribosome-binding protein aMBF1 (putative translation factor)